MYAAGCAEAPGHKLRVRVARPPPGRAADGLLEVVRLLRGFRGSGLSGVTGACPSRAADLASAQQQATHLADLHQHSSKQHIRSTAS